MLEQSYRAQVRRSCVMLDQSYRAQVRTEHTKKR